MTAMATSRCAKFAAWDDEIERMSSAFEHEGFAVSWRVEDPWNVAYEKCGV
ncbi:MAG: hypothetical protein U5R48_18585 [Gammaproteobacteria bacterium]|nr:hypothetical protein [Gammaproteobacteria bacterium]